MNGCLHEIGGRLGLLLVDNGVFSTFCRCGRAVPKSSADIGNHAVCGSLSYFPGRRLVKPTSDVPCCLLEPVRMTANDPLRHMLGTLGVDGVREVGAHLFCYPSPCGARA